jgi:hypothetical protein
MSRATKKAKPLKSYLFEGLMIFLAVLLGFFAENVREEYADKNKEKQFIKSLVENLKTDSIVFMNRDSSMKTRIIYMDTLNSILIRQQRNRNAEAYLLTRYATRITHHRPGISTINYLSKSTAYASIEDGEAKQQIQEYESDLNWMKSLIDLEEEMGIKLYPLIPQLFNSKVFLEMKQTGFGLQSFSMPDGNPAFLTNDPIRINELVYHLYLRRSQTYSEVLHLDRIDISRKKLIKFLEEKYRLY